LVPGPVLGANAPASQSSLSRETVRDYLSQMSDAEVGALVRGRLDTPPSTARRGQDLATATSAVDEFRSRVHDLVPAARDLPELPAIVAAKLEEGDPGRPLRILGLFLVMAGAGLALEMLGLWALRDVTRRLRQSLVSGPLAAALRTLLLIVLGTLRVALSALGALPVLLAGSPTHLPTRHVLLAALGAVVLVRLVAIGARVVLAPSHRALRLVPFDDRAARRLYVALIGLATLAVVGTLGARLLTLLGVPEPDVVILLTLVRILFAMVLLFG